jgi:hypothetical protein
MTTMTLTTPAPVVPEPRTDGLHLTAVLVAGLPVELGTSAAPARYTVPVVFSRQVSAQERTRIEDPATAAALRSHTAGDIELVVSDRRLLVLNTSLAELRDGLGSALAAMLREMETEIDDARDRRDAELDAARQVERERSDTLTREAAEVRFE